METESKYLKKIRDMIHKKNSGSSSGTIYSGPNTKAKYLNDIAKEIDKLDIGGGGSSDSPIFIINCIKNTSNNQWYVDKTDEEIAAAYDSGKILLLHRQNWIYEFNKQYEDGSDICYQFYKLAIEPSTKPGDNTKPALKSITNYINIIGNTGGYVSISTDTTYYMVNDIQTMLV